MYITGGASDDFIIDFFTMTTALAGQDYTINSSNFIGEERVKFSRPDCMLMLKCARTLAPAPKAGG